MNVIEKYSKFKDVILTLKEEWRMKEIIVDSLELCLIFYNNKSGLCLWIMFDRFLHDCNLLRLLHVFENV